MSEARLDVAQFAEFYAAVWRYDPFPWQTALTEQVHTDGRWPKLLDLPTGTGKTSVIDIAVFLLALDAGRLPEDRVMPRRIVLVVDRRVIVDQAAERAQDLANSLAARDAAPVLRSIARALRSLWTDPDSAELPLLGSVLRGGIVRDETWARRPDVPAVLASTVDQVGSRLLFRGYGVSPRMRPVHAGLLGADTLFLLDEVHLSRPFAHTLREIDKYGLWAERRVARRWSVVELSATPGRAEHDRFPHEPLDPESSPVLRRRLRASKPAQLRAVKGGEKARQALADAAASAMVEILEQDHVRSAAVVVNRVETARRAAAALAEQHGHQAVLLTGRMRPIDRDGVVKSVRERVRTGRTRTGGEPRLVIVATQCIEAGADFDFDGLVTECASLDALRQRFGRVDRDGRLSEQGTPAPSVILVASSDVGPGANDAVYGSALAATWEWLDGGLGTVDFGVTCMDSQTVSQDRSLLAPTATAPYLLPAHLDAWVQTRPTPSPDPDPALWLHGLERPTSPEVQVVWRADLTEDFLGTEPDVRREEYVFDLIAACPPGSSEAMSIPLAAVRAWLTAGADAASVPVTDVEGASAEVETPNADMRPAVRWRRDEPRVVRGAAELAPGDVVVVPAEYGGIRNGNWDPESIPSVDDLGLRVQVGQRGRAVLRFLPRLWPDVTEPPRPEAVAEDQQDAVVIQDWLEANLSSFDDWTASVVQQCLARWPSVRIRRVVGPAFRRDPAAGEHSKGDWVTARGVASYFVLSCQLPASTLHVRAGDQPEAYEPEEDGSSFTAVEVPLDDHLSGVERWARALAINSGLPEDLVEDVALAGRLHDLGKADPRFQVILHSGDEIAAAVGPLLAKSAVPDSDRGRRDAIRRRSGYPQGARHELLSLDIITRAAEVQASAHDWDLVQHLVASHHGWCRPFAPVAPDDAPQRVEFRVLGGRWAGRTDHGLARLDSGVTKRFWRLVRRYGWHGLAWLEAILQLADHRRSAEEQSQSWSADSGTVTGLSRAAL